MLKVFNLLIIILALNTIQSARKKLASVKLQMLIMCLNKCKEIQSQLGIKEN